MTVRKLTCKFRKCRLQWEPLSRRLVAQTQCHGMSAERPSVSCRDDRLPRLLRIAIMRHCVAL